MKNKLPKIGVLVILLLLGMTVITLPESPVISKSEEKSDSFQRSSVVWSDDFEDEDISDWQIFGVNHTADPDYLLPGSCSASGGVLRPNGPEWNYAGYNSSVAYGTWSFDVDVQEVSEEGNHHFSVAFISEQFNDDWLSFARLGEVYALIFYTNANDDSGQINLGLSSHDPITLNVLGYWATANLLGWRHIDITREESGQFYVYVDGVLRIDAIDTVHTTSERFYFLSCQNTGIDDISVSNTIDYDAAPPKWDESPADHVIDFGNPFSYDLNASDYSGIDEWVVNDTAHFAIDDDGVITNSVTLDARTYPLNVEVSDTLGNTLNANFTVTVQSTGQPLDISFILLGGGVAIIVLALVLVIIKKRS
ncbi:MAG: hypothetical protein ACXAAP_14450 [Candidatus Thorarchaeota archaeon]|jgi:hypothetical protein